MNLAKTSLLNAIAVAGKMIALLGINKILAVYVGPAGYAAIGQFQNAVQLITVLAGGATHVGITKYTAEYHKNQEKQYRVWRTAGSVSLISVSIIGVALITYNKQLATFLLSDAAYGYVFIWFAFMLVLFVLNNFLLAVLNGRKNIQLSVISNIFSSIFAGALIFVLTAAYGLSGALISVVTYQSLSFFVTFLICRRYGWFRIHNFFGKIDFSIAKNLMKYSAMTLVNVACLPIGYILVRDFLGESKGWEVAGHWEAMCRFSAAYLMFFTTTLNIYYLPKFAELKRPDEIKKEIIHGYKIILPLLLLVGLVAYMVRDTAIELLFHSDFLPMRDLFFYQMIGDVLKMGGWFLTCLMLGRAMAKEYIAAEILFSSLFVFLATWFMPKMGAEGVVLAYAISCGLYWMMMLVLSRRIWI